MDFNEEYNRWLRFVTDSEILGELKCMDRSSIEEAFSRELEFGTGGLRGILGAGTNRINIYVVAKASQGLANYLCSKGTKDALSVVIGYDSRINSEQFAKTAAGVFAANGINVWFWRELNPVPTVSYAVRYLKASAGVMITASHNPSRYNGYKVYGSDGCQITPDIAEEVYDKINNLDIFSSVVIMDFEKAVEGNKVRYIDDVVMDAYINEIKNQSVLFGDEIKRDIAIVFTPLNGSGLKPIIRVLSESGFTNIVVVDEQKDADGHFPTCPYPNPEDQEAMELGLKYCKRVGADILIATDPDADRCGIAVRDTDGSYRLLSGNEVGLLLLEYICSQRKKHNVMPAEPLFVKTIVTVDLAERIADYYGVKTINVLTGFKYIGNVIGKLKDERDYIFGFEESYGYLTGSYVRDKDGVDAAYIVCEMLAYYRTRGIGLNDRLNDIYRTYGYCHNTLHSYKFPGTVGMKKIADVMKRFRTGVDCLGDEEVVKTMDYSVGIDGLPKSDVLKFIIKNGSIVVRPSGTEPKLKIYISVCRNDEHEAAVLEKRILKDIEGYVL